MSGSNEEIVANIKANLANPQLQKDRALLNKERNESFDDFANSPFPDKLGRSSSDRDPSIYKQFTPAPSEEQQRKETRERTFGTQSDAERQADQAAVRAAAALENQRSLAEFNASRGTGTSPIGETLAGPTTVATPTPTQTSAPLTPTSTAKSTRAAMTPS